MAKDKKAKPTKTRTGAAPAAKPKRAAPKKGNAKVVTKAVKGAKKIAKNPMTTEIVAATLVAAAAALRDPKKAKALALEAADLKKAAKSGADGGALWKLALDVARRSIDTVGNDGAKKAKKSGAKKKK